MSCCVSRCVLVHNFSKPRPMRWTSTINFQSSFPILCFGMWCRAFRCVLLHISSETTVCAMETRLRFRVIFSNLSKGIVTLTAVENDVFYIEFWHVCWCVLLCSGAHFLWNHGLCDGNTSSISSRLPELNCFGITNAREISNVDICISQGGILHIICGIHYVLHVAEGLPMREKTKPLSWARHLPTPHQWGDNYGQGRQN